MKIALLLALLATPAAADLNAALDAQILPGFAAFASQTAALRDAAAADCTPATLHDPYNIAFDAWMGVSHLRIGPLEQGSRAIAIAFWPDERGTTPKALADLIAAQDPIIETTDGVAQISIAGRGLFALEFMLYDPDFSEKSDYSCALIRALTADLAHLAADVQMEWEGGYAETLRSAGQPGNRTYLSQAEGNQALFTALATGLEFTQDSRLGRPLGTFDRPRPLRAEAWRSGRSQRNVILSVQALAGLADALSDGATPLTDAAVAKAVQLAAAFDDPAFAGVSDPSGRLKVEILQQAVIDLRDAILAEVGADLGVSTGFNAADGD